MSNPQQPEIRRSGRGEVVQEAVKERHGGPTDESGNPGPVPEANEPDHRPEVDQDKPTESRRPIGRRSSPDRCRRRPRPPGRR